MINPKLTLKQNRCQQNLYKPLSKAAENSNSIRQRFGLVVGFGDFAESGDLSTGKCPAYLQAPGRVSRARVWRARVWRARVWRARFWRARAERERAWAWRARLRQDQVQERQSTASESHRGRDL